MTQKEEKADSDQQEVIDNKYWEREYGKLAGFHYRILLQVMNDFRLVADKAKRAKEATRSEGFNIMDEITEYSKSIASAVDGIAKKIEENLNFERPPPNAPAKPKAMIGPLPGPMEES